ncbi:MAG: hypothetical protein ABJB74_18600 [Gemmatimonas sp.]
MRLSSLALTATIVLAGATAACSDDPATQPQTANAIAGLTVTASNDTVTTPQNTPTGSGFFQGTVIGPSTSPGTDTLTTSPRIADVRVTIYPRLADVNGQITMGPAAGSTTSNAQGKWTLPTLPAGDYIVAFVPPASGVYSGAYAFGPLRSNSAQFVWWVVLNKK